MNPGETIEQTGVRAEGSGTRRPGLVVVYDAGKPAYQAFEVSKTGLELGRGSPGGVFKPTTAYPGGT